MNSYTKGLWAEWVAALYMMLRGYRFRAWRYKTPVGEIDLVMSRGRQIVFVEVKARAKIDDGVGAIRTASYSRLQRAAEHYLTRYARGRTDAPECRFDLVVVAPPCRIKHLDNIMLYGS